MNKKFLSKHWGLLLINIIWLALIAYLLVTKDYKEAMEILGYMIWTVLVLFQQVHIVKLEERLEVSRSVLVTAHQALNQAIDIIKELKEKLKKSK